MPRSLHLKQVSLLTLLWMSVLIFMSGCGEDEMPTSLQELVEDNASSTNELVACAAGGQQGFLTEDGFPINVFFYPELDAQEFRYFETGSDAVDPEDLSAYVEQDRESLPLFNGFLQRYPLEESADRWARVSFVSDDTLWYSRAILLSLAQNPTEFSPELCELDDSQTLEPIFTWEDGEDTDNIIYFHVVSAPGGAALSGTYTEEKNFQYYNLDNVVFNVTRPGQAQPLIAGESYDFTLMGVNPVNWVNVIMAKSFEAR